MQTEAMLDWARVAFPYSGPSLPPTPPPGATDVQTASHNLVAGLAMCADPASREDSLYRVGIGLNGLARHLKDGGKPDAGIQTFKMAYGVLTSIQTQAEHHRKAIGFSFANLKRLGAEPLAASAVLSPQSEPLMDLTPLLIPAPPEEAVDIPQDAPSAQPSQPNENSSLAELLEELQRRWPTPSGTSFDASSALNAYLKEILANSGILDRDLGQLVRADLETLAAKVRDLPSDRECLQEITREFRSFAFRAGDDEKERRHRWLFATLANCALWKKPGGLPTNEPQVMIDLMGYVGAVLMDRRYNDTDRDMLLDCAETQVRVAHALAPVVFARFGYLGDWVLAAAGTYLLLAGPNPASPKDSYYDERVQSDSPAHGRGLRREVRHAWPEVLLNQWQPATDSASAASHALATVCGWDASRGRWLVDLIFDRSRDQQRDLSREFWLRTLEDLLARVARVRIATNPWRTSKAASTRDNMVMTDEKGRFIIPDAVLRAAAAQGLRAGEIATVHGKLFQGRRVPTFLLTNRFGPYAILKIDHRDKVLREREHFDTYARRLHQSHRPSECHAHPMDLYLGQSGAAVRAIETAYVFEPRDEPLTMTEWTARSTADEVSAVIKDFLCEDLRPWLAHVHRDRVDLRAEYPVFRPGPVEGKQAPANWCAEEITKLERADLGASLSRTERDCPWLAVLQGSNALSGVPTPVCPLWFAAEIAEIGTGALSWVMDARDIALRDFDTLLSLSHGDLHLDNVLCTSAKSSRPHAVLIDFESAHDGHVCKDIARLEASFLCQVFEPDAVFAERIAAWFAGSISSDEALFTPPLQDESDTHVRLVMTAIRQLREVVAGCGQGHWPIRYDEYVFALIGALLPMARYTTLKMTQRQLALLLSSVSAGYLVRHWESRSSGA